MDVGPMFDTRTLVFLGCAMGIIGSLGLYGFQQERIMSLPYGDEDFTDSVFLVLCNRIMSMAFAMAMIVRHREPWWNTPPLWKYGAVSVSNVIATTCQYEALKYVSFPAQMLGKSAKMVPVMVWSIIMARNLRKFGVKEWMVAVGVTGGCMIFLAAGDVSAKRAAQSTSFYGMFLMLGYLGADGFTSSFQEMLFKAPGVEKATKYNQMLYINLCAATMSIFWLVPSGQLAHALGFATRHPGLLVDTAMLSVGATFGQFCIYTTIQEFGAVVFAALMNVRQVVSIVTSLLYYGNSINLTQVLGLAMVFGCLFYKSYASRQKESEKPSAEKKTAPPTEDPDRQEQGLAQKIGDKHGNEYCKVH